MLIQEVTTSPSKDKAVQLEYQDDKAPICVPFILSLLATHPPTPPRPFIIGLNGLQGIGKTTLVDILASELQSSGYETLVISIDDFYLTRKDQIALAASQPDNPLVQHRGEPGTHEVSLAVSFFQKLCRGETAKVPKYDKSAFSGRGDRISDEAWPVVNGEGRPKVQVIILEGWCVGFRSLAKDELRKKWEGASITLGSHRFEHLESINAKLRDYDALTNLLDAFIHLDADDISYVYDWRLEQEAMLRAERGAGMTDAEVIRFVDGYYPAYELYSEGVRAGVLQGRPKHQLRLVVDKDRTVKERLII